MRSKKTKRTPPIFQLLEVVVARRVLGLRDDDAAHAVHVELLADAHLALVAFVALRHHDVVAPLAGTLLYAVEDGGEVVVGYLRHDYAYQLCGGRAAVAQLVGKEVGKEVMLARVPYYLVFLYGADARVVFQRARHRRHRHAKLARNVFHRQKNLLCHCLRFFIGKFTINNR